MNNRFDFDGALKELFQRDRPSLLDRLTGGVAIRQFLNVELPTVLERRADLVALLASEMVLHFELQSDNDGDLPYREGIYCILLGQLYRRKVRQVVLYVGRAKMRMPEGVDLGTTQVAYELIDIRDFDAGELLKTGRAADSVLAILARGGGARLPQIVRRVARLKGAARERAMAQLLVLSGLRALSSRVEWEMKRM